MRRLVALAEHPFELLFGLLALLNGAALTLAAVAAVYSVVALGYAGAGALFPVGVLAAVAVACVARARALAALERAIVQHMGGTDGG